MPKHGTRFAFSYRLEHHTGDDLTARRDSSRTSSFAVLTYAAGGAVLDKMSEAIREEAGTRRRQTTTPVIASASWDFAADGGSSAQSVL